MADLADVVCGGQDMMQGQLAGSSYSMQVISPRTSISSVMSPGSEQHTQRLKGGYFHNVVEWWGEKWWGEMVRRTGGENW